MHMKWKFHSSLILLAALLCILVSSNKVHADSVIPDEIKDNGIPVLCLTIDPDDYQRIYDSIDHSEKAAGSISIDVPEGYTGDYSDTVLEDTGDLELEYIRGRGNSTWSVDKRPFKFKLKKSSNLLGMGANKHWVLLANAFDPSLMRNRLISYIGNRLGMEYTPKMLPVDLVINGSYAGSYVLSEQVRVGKNRIEIDELKAEDVEEPEISGGYLLALQPTESEGESNIYTTDNQVSFLMKSPVFESEDPDETLGAAQQREYICNYLARTEQAIFSEDMKDESGNSYRDYLDIDSAADYWWVQEFSKNNDAYNTTSTYLYKKRNGKLFWGPLWDFDLTMCKEYGSEGFGNTGTPWMDQMRKNDPEFVNLLKEKWETFSTILEDITKDGGILDHYADEIRLSWEDDYRLWGESYNNGWVDHTDSFEEAIEDPKTFIVNRSAWISQNIDTELDKVYCYVYAYADNELCETITSRYGSSFNPAEISAPAAKDGYVFVGWEDQEGNLLEGDISLCDDMYIFARFILEEEAVPASGIYTGMDEAWIDRNQNSYQIDYSIVPADAQDKRVSWESSDSSLANVDQGGLVVLNNEGLTGDVILTGTTHSGFTASFVLHIYDPETTTIYDAESLQAESDQLTLKPGQYGKMKITASPLPCNVGLFYTVNTEGIINIDENGVIKALNPGKCTVTVTDNFTECSTEYVVVVEEETESTYVTKEDLKESNEELVQELKDLLKEIQDEASANEGHQNAMIQLANTLIDVYENVNMTKYTSSSVKVLKKALEEATAVLENTNSGTDDLNKANLAVLNARRNLKKKKTNTLKVKGKTVKIKAKKLKKKAQSIQRKKAISYSRARGKVTYKLSGVTPAKYKKYFKVNKKTGKITVKKKLKKGSYKIRIKLTAAGNGTYLAGTKTVVVRLKVK